MLEPAQAQSSQQAPVQARASQQALVQEWASPQAQARERASPQAQEQERASPQAQEREAEAYSRREPLRGLRAEAVPQRVRPFAAARAAAAPWERKGQQRTASASWKSDAQGEAYWRGISRQAKSSP